ncbi:hypothetical protein [Saccharomonospora azurea]|uniref:Uncharacterized protein n=1 Tax=Saccharomonospora azurea NA-128 TaxID=882081 RepID=H8G5R8_9PSEU|nr:hypothetical protein [Saccharomonospora azurea]EHY90230.1 hypothetical protein SacazDRAFT_03353 [Saccharomonospora azurea NA-128]
MTDQTPPTWQVPPPPPQQPFQSPQQAPTAPRGWGRALAGVLVGLLLGGGGVGLTWFLLSDAEGDGAAADAQEACAIVERTPTVMPTEDDVSDMHRWGAAMSLAMAAAEADPTYESLSKAIHKPLLIFQQKYDVEDDPDYQAAMTAARDACAEL